MYIHNNRYQRCTCPTESWEVYKSDTVQKRFRPGCNSDTVLHNDDMRNWSVFKYWIWENHFLNWTQARLLMGMNTPSSQTSQVVNIVFRYKTRMCSGTCIITRHLRCRTLVISISLTTRLLLRVSNFPSKEWSSSKMWFFFIVSIGRDYS